jgi:hypothetical protein
MRSLVPFLQILSIASYIIHLVAVIIDTGVMVCLNEYFSISLKKRGRTTEISDVIGHI